MQDRGESSAQPQPQPQGWAPSYEQQQSGQFPQPPQWDQGAQYGAPQPSYGQAPSGPPASAASVKRRPRWKTPLIAAVALVVGIAIGAAAGGGSKNGGSPTSAAAGTASTAPSAPAAGAAKPAAPATSAAAPAPVAAPATAVVLALSGNGQKTSKSFTIAKGDWSLKYSYTCSDGQGLFQVYEDYPSGSILANELSTKGGQTTYQHADSGKHSLTVNSTCAWTLTVTDGDGG